MNFNFTKNSFLKLNNPKKEDKIKSVEQIRNEINKRQGKYCMGNINNIENEKSEITKQDIHRTNVNNLRNINKD